MAQVQRDVTLIYEGVDITGDVDLLECVCRDVSRGEADCLNMLVDHADKWFRWGPQKNDRIRVTRSGYDTKTLFLNTVVPEDGAYRIYATASKSVPFTQRWQDYQNKTLGSVLNMCAGECGMSAKLSGISPGILYEYLLRDNMSAPYFMEQLLNREGAVLKALDGKYTAIYVPYAQTLPPMHEMKLDDDQLDSVYTDRRDLSWSSVEIRTVTGHGLAKDRKAKGGQQRVLTDIPVDNDAHAYRWAKGLLLMHNRMSETIHIEMDFNPGYTAMVRVNVKSETDAAGEWLVHETTQNLLDGRTQAVLIRCLKDIG